MHRRVILSVLTVFGLLLAGASSAASAATRPAANPGLRYLGPVHAGGITKNSTSPPYDVCGGTGTFNVTANSISL